MIVFLNKDNRLELAIQLTKDAKESIAIRSIYYINEAGMAIRNMELVLLYQADIPSQL
jgi:hypothetical protein